VAALPAALALVGVFGLVLGAITLRLSGHYLSIATIAWGIAIYYVFGNLPGLGEYSGIDNLPPIALAGWRLDTAPRIYYLIWATTIVALVAAMNLLDSRAGRALRALRFRGVMAESFGVDTARLKVLVFLYAALLAGVSGWLHAHFLRFVSPHAFGVNAGIDYLFMAVIGGASHVWGAVIGSSVLTMLREWLKDLLPAAIQRTGNYEIVVFGVLMLVLLQRTRNGIAPALAHLLPAPARRTPSLQAEPLPRREQPPPGEPLLELDAVRIRFGGLVAVNRMSFGLRSGEILGLIGPNGAGKTTMFNLITGVLSPESGSIRFLGERIDTLGQRGIARRGLVRTFQHVNLVSSMSVLENVAIGAHLRGRSGTLAAMAHTERVEDERLLAEAARQLQRVGLGEHLHEPAGSLALGQQRIGRDRARARRRPDPAAARRAGGRPALRREAGIGRLVAPPARRTHQRAARRARHGFRDGPGRPARRDGFRREAGRRRAAGDPVRRRRARGIPGRNRVNAPLLEVDALRVCYGKVEALHGVSVRVDEGSIVTVIGPNGAGKSTLLGAIMGLLPSTGRVRYDGAELGTTEIEARVARGICLVPERRELFGEMSVEDNLRLGAFQRVRNGERGADSDFGEVYARFPRLHERRTQLAATLSGGERQMLALGRALMGKPRLLMLDEPSLAWRRGSCARSCISSPTCERPAFRSCSSSRTHARRCSRRPRLRARDRRHRARGHLGGVERKSAGGRVVPRTGQPHERNKGNPGMTHRFANPLLAEPARAMPRHIGIIGAGSIGPDIATT